MFESNKKEGKHWDPPSPLSPPPPSTHPPSFLLVDRQRSTLELLTTGLPSQPFFCQELW